MKSSNRLWVILKILFLFINIGVALALILSYAAYYIDPQQYWYFALFGLLYPWILLANIMCILGWLLLWKKYIWISLIMVLLGWKQLNNLFAFNFSKPMMPPGITIKMMTYNVHGFYGPANAERTYRNDIMEFIANEQPDIVCLQEFHIREADTKPAIRHMAGSWQLPYHVMTNYFESRSSGNINGISTFSRYPIIRHDILEHATGKRFCLSADVLVGSDTIRVFNVHLASLHLNQDDVNFYYQLKTNSTDNVEVKKGIFSIMKKLKAAFILRSKQIIMLNQAIYVSPYPVLVCGDMNDSPFSFTYHKLTENLTDAYGEAEKGFFGHTYDGALPNYRIDYILHDNYFKTYNYSKSKLRFSDHYPVQCVIRLNEQAHLQ